MADLGTSTAPTGPDEVPSTELGRRVTRRRTLPGGRAVVGALLITVAVVGVFAAWLSATAAPSTTFAVVRRDLAPGDTLASDDVRVVAMDLPAEQAARAFTSVDDVAGTVALAPLAPGDLLVRSVVRDADQVPDTAEFSFEVPATQALAGEVVAGDRVDVVATDEGITGYVATDVAVVASTVDGGVVTLTVALDDPDLVLAIAHAADEATVHVARSNATRPADTTTRQGSFGDPVTTGSDEPTPTVSGSATPSSDDTGNADDAATDGVDGPVDGVEAPATPDGSG